MSPDNFDCISKEGFPLRTNQEDQYSPKLLDNSSLLHTIVSVVGEDREILIPGSLDLERKSLSEFFSLTEFVLQRLRCLAHSVLSLVNGLSGDESVDHGLRKVVPHVVLDQTLGEVCGHNYL